jgi:hypothetical protein
VPQGLVLLARSGNRFIRHADNREKTPKI